MSESAGIAMTTVFFMLVIVNIVGNSLVCAIIKRNRDMRIHVNYLLWNLAVQDILFGTFIAPRLFFKLTGAHHPDGLTGTVLCKLLTDGNVATIGAASSGVTLVAIAIERYYAVVYPLGNKGELTERKLKVSIPCSWIAGIIIISPYFFVTDIVKEKGRNSCVDIWPEEWMAKAYSLSWVVLTALFLALMVVLYSRAVYTLWVKQNDDNQLTNQQRGVMRVRKRVTLMIVAVTVIFGICWGTSSIVYALHYLSSYNIGPVPIVISSTMVLFNSAVNPFVYALLNQQFRKKMKKMICCTVLVPYHPGFILRRNPRSSTTPPTRPTQQDHVPQSDVLITF